MQPNDLKNKIKFFESLKSVNDISYLDKIKKETKREIEKENEYNIFKQINNDESDIIDIPIDNEIIIQPDEISLNIINFVCPYCNVSHISEQAYNNHVNITHDYYENYVCVCEKCNMIFENNNSYNQHLDFCSNTNRIVSIPTDDNGQYICPTCENKYSNAFFLGEHFTIEHNDYDMLCKLDNKEPTGFPGFKVLYKINMIEKMNEFTHEICDICQFNFSHVKNKNRYPLKFSCCKHLICRDCLLNHISISDSIKCPYCMKDHTRIDLDYIIFIKEIMTTDRNKWLQWWEDHIELFN